MKVFNIDDFITLPYMGRCKKFKQATEYHEFETCTATDDECGMTKHHGCKGCAYR